jgi:hypothetical protein
MSGDAPLGGEGVDLALQIGPLGGKPVSLVGAPWPRRWPLGSRDHLVAGEPERLGHRTQAIQRLLRDLLGRVGGLRRCFRGRACVWAR